MVRKYDKFLSGSLSTGQNMVSSGSLSYQVEETILVVQAMWALFKEEAGNRSVTMRSATYLSADCNETDSVKTLAKVNSSALRVCFESSAACVSFISSINMLRILTKMS